jgi:NADH dehydrogenase FAD-containing subunit
LAVSPQPHQYGHAGFRLTARLRDRPAVELILVDRHDYHQAITELPRVVGGTRAADAVRIPLQDMLAARVRFVQTEITGFDLAGRRLLTGAGPIGWRRLVLALGSRPNDFAIPGLAQRTLSVILPQAASGHGLAPGRPAVQLIEAGPAILAGSSPQLIDKAAGILADLRVQVRTNAKIAAATADGFRLTDGQLVQGGVFVWAGGVKAPELVAGSELPTGHNGRVKVDRYLRVLDRPWARWRLRLR